jgi:hypothetical protein
MRCRATGGVWTKNANCEKKEKTYLTTELLACNCGETDCGVNLSPDLVEKGLRCNVTQVLGNFEVTVSTNTLGMDLRFVVLASK